MEDELTIHVPIMKDCIEKLLDEGCTERLFDWEKLAFRIMMELKRLEQPQEKIRQIVEEWARKSGVSNVTVQKRVPEMVDWVLKRGGELGCRGVLVDEDLCIKGGNPHDCKYDRMYQDQLGARKLAKAYPEENWKGWRNWLQTGDRKSGPLAAELYDIIRGRERFQGARVCVSYRGFCHEIKNRFKNWNPLPMAACRAIRCLEGHGLVKIVSRGKKGIKSGIANGYQRTLPIPEPPD